MSYYTKPSRGQSDGMRNMGLIRPRRWKRLVIYAIVSVTTFYVVLSMTSNNNHSPFQDKYEFDDSVIQALKKKPGKIPSKDTFVDDSGQQTWYLLSLCKAT